jgi:hypothetical protein
LSYGFCDGSAGAEGSESYINGYFRPSYYYFYFKLSEGPKSSKYISILIVATFLKISPDSLYSSTGKYASNTFA